MSAKQLLNTYGPNLPGVRGGKLRGPMAKSVNGFMEALKSYRAVSDAGDHGAVMVWVDDDGLYRCHFMVRFFSQNEQILKRKSEVRKWLATWLPKQREVRP